MGVNLVTRVRNFFIETRSFTASDHDVQDGCVTPGNHKLLRFDFLSYNAGNADLVIGSPAARPDLFVWSAAHGHYHLKDFNEFLFFDATGHLATVGYKQAFCAIDIERISSTASASGRFHDCNSDQGISAGWADVYSSGLPCQFIVIDGLPDGEYTLQSTTNSQHKVGEDCYGDNTIWTGLRLAGNTVAVIDPPFIPEDRIGFNRANVAAIQAGGRWKVAEGGTHWMLDTGTSPWEAQRCVDLINHYKLASLCFVGRPRCGDTQPMMYWLDDQGRAPSGSVPDEDVIPFDRHNLQVIQVGDRWKVVEGTHWLLDFGPAEGNAVAALHFIRKYRFDEICFVGRPGPSMTYFKTRGRRVRPSILVDPRALDVSLDEPRWRKEVTEASAALAPNIDFTDASPGPGPSVRRFGALALDVLNSETSTVTTIHGLTGLLLPEEIEIRLDEKTTVVDISLAHFGQPPTVIAYAGDKEVATLDAGAIQRQFENLRLTAPSIDRLRIRTPGTDQALVGYIRFQPKRRRSRKGTATVR